MSAKKSLGMKVEVRGGVGEINWLWTEVRGNTVHLRPLAHARGSVGCCSSEPRTSVSGLSVWSLGYKKHQYNAVGNRLPWFQLHHPRILPLPHGTERIGVIELRLQGDKGFI